MDTLHDIVIACAVAFLCYSTGYAFFRAGYACAMVHMKMQPKRSHQGFIDDTSPWAFNPRAVGELKGEHPALKELSPRDAVQDGVVRYHTRLLSRAAGSRFGTEELRN